MLYQAFVDESGNRNNNKNFSMCAVVSTPEKWLNFSREWNKCLNLHPKIYAFKMKDAAGKSGTWRSFSEDQRDQRLAMFADIINEYVEFVFHSVIDIEGHSETWGKFCGKPHNELYFWPFHNTIHAICLQLHDLGFRGSIDITFDEQVVFGPRAKEWYPLMKKAINFHNPEVLSLLPAEPKFGRDQDFLPIQAADLFSWLLRKAYDDPDDHKFGWIVEHLKSIRTSEYSQYYDRDRMQAVIDQSNQIASNGELEKFLGEIR